jgi:hypothetical protein
MAKSRGICTPQIGALDPVGPAHPSNCAAADGARACRPTARGVRGCPPARYGSGVGITVGAVPGIKRRRSAIHVRIELNWLARSRFDPADRSSSLRSALRKSSRTICRILATSASGSVSDCTVIPSKSASHSRSRSDRNHRRTLRARAGPGRRPPSHRMWIFCYLTRYWTLVHVRKETDTGEWGRHSRDQLGGGGVSSGCGPGIGRVPSRPRIRSSLQMKSRHDHAGADRVAVTRHHYAAARF